VPLAHVFESVLHTKVAMAHDYIAKPKTGDAEPQKQEPAKEPEKEPSVESKPRKTKPPPSRGSKRPPPPANGEEPATTDESEWVEIPESVR
jgi:hypothetical protein